MGQKVCANNIIRVFRERIGEPTMQLNDVHRLMARYGMEPVANNQRGPIYDWDDVDYVLNAIYHAKQEGKFQFKYQEKPKFNPNEKWPHEDYSAPEEHMDYVSKEYENLEESMKKRKIYLTEKQINDIEQKLNEGKTPVDVNRVLVVKKFLDSNFTKGGISAMSEDGYPATIKIVALKGTDGQPIKNMTDVQLFDMLQDKFFKLYTDTGVRDRLLKQIIKDWYKGKITKHGMLSVNFV